MTKCKNADKYQGIYPPKCNGGDPCDTCKMIYKKANEAVFPDDGGWATFGGGLVGGCSF